MEIGLVADRAVDERHARRQSRRRPPFALLARARHDGKRREPFVEFARDEEEPLVEVNALHAPRGREGSAGPEVAEVAQDQRRFGEERAVLQTKRGHIPLGIDPMEVLPVGRLLRPQIDADEFERPPQLVEDDVRGQRADVGSVEERHRLGHGLFVGAGTRLNNRRILITMFTRMNSRPDFAAIQAFATVADTGSFRAAAQTLSAPVSTVSIQVSRLEDRLGTKLLERTTRKVSLTEEGRAYFEQVRGALDVMIEAEHAVAGRTHEARGSLRIAAPSEFGQAVLGKVLSRYMLEYPEVNLEIELSGERRDPWRDGFDVVIQTEPAESVLLVARKLGSPMKYRVLASPSYLARRGRPSHPADLSKHRCLTMGARHTANVWRFVKGAKTSTIVHRHATANSWALLRDLAIAGCGIARLPDYLAAPAIAEGKVEAVLDDFSPRPEQLFAVYAKSRQVPLRTTGFVEMLRQFLDVWPGCLTKEHPRRRVGQALRVAASDR